MCEHDAARDRHPGHLDDERGADLRLDPEEYVLPVERTIRVDMTAAQRLRHRSAGRGRMGGRLNPGV